MARQNHAAQVLLGAYGAYGAGLADYTYTAGDIVNNEQTPLTGREIVLIENTDAGAQTITFTSTNDTFGRTQDITAYSMAANDFAMFGPFEQTGWLQTDGNLYFTVSAVTMRIAVVRLPVGF